MFQDKIKNYFSSLAGKRVTVVGIGVSHLPLQGEQITAVFQIEGGKAMAYLIRGELHACAITVFSEVPSQHIGL